MIKTKLQAESRNKVVPESETETETVEAFVPVIFADLLILIYGFLKKKNSKDQL